MRTLTRYACGILTAVGVALLLHPAALAQTVGCGGSFVPSFNCLIKGLWDFTPQNPTTAYDVPFKANGDEATGVVSKVVTLTNAQILALHSTPVTLVAAPGVGRYVDVISISLVFKYTATYANPQDVRCYWGTAATGNACSPTITGSGFFSATADTAIRVAGVPDNTNPPATNLAIVLRQIKGGAMTGGNASNSIRVIIHYRIVTTNLAT